MLLHWNQAGNLGSSIVSEYYCVIYHEYVCVALYRKKRLHRKAAEGVERPLGETPIRLENFFLVNLQLKSS